MLKLIENLGAQTASQLSTFVPDTLSGRYVLFSLLDFTGVDGAWVQTIDDEVTALVVQKEMSKVFVTATDEADFYELGDFILRLGGMVVHCPDSISEKIGMTAYSKLTLMRLEGEIPEGRASVELNDNLRPVFELLIQSKKKPLITEDKKAYKEIQKFTDRAYNEWLAKTSRGIFNGFTSVRAVKAGENSVLSVAVADRLGSTVYLRDVATDSDFRRMGYASDCISGICKDFCKNGEEIFLACNDLQSENFYRKIGFVRKEYMDVGIFEI